MFAIKEQVRENHAGVSLYNVYHLDSTFTYTSLQFETFVQLLVQSVE